MTHYRTKGQPFTEFAASVKGRSGIIIAIDPGLTTGWAVFEDYELIGCGQLPTGTVKQAYIAAQQVISGSVGWRNQLRGKNSARAPGPSTPMCSPLRQVQTDSRLTYPDYTLLPEEESPDTPKVVIEDYRVYSWKSDDHKLSDVFTVKVLGIFELVASFYGYPKQLNLAHLAKKFCTDQKLQDWGFWMPAMKHARDAIRHGAYYIIQDSQGTKPVARKFDS
jgi:hypothetical protein